MNLSKVCARLRAESEKENTYSVVGEWKKSSYIQCIKSTTRPIYSEQFHGAVVNDYLFFHKPIGSGKYPVQQIFPFTSLLLYQSENLPVISKSF